MNLLKKSLFPVLLLAALAVACGEKEEAPAAAPVVTTPVEVAAPVAVEPEPTGGGGYEPAADERIPGITIPTDAVKTPVVDAAAAAK